MDRNAAIDVSRAIAVMLVTIFHVPKGPFMPTCAVGDFDLFAFMHNGWVGVGIFFIISGYCMGMSTQREFRNGVTIRNYSRYAFKRFMRIAPPYYISIVVWVFIITQYNISPKPTAFKDILTHVTFTHNLFSETFFSISGVYWSIGVEIQFYLLLPFLTVLCRGFASTCFTMLILLAVSIATYKSQLDITYKWGLLNYLVLFVYGWALYVYKDIIVNLVNKTNMIYLAVPLFFLLMSYTGGGHDNRQKIYETVVSLVYGVIMVKLDDVLAHRERSPFISVLLLTGKASFSIYLYNYIYSLVMPKVPNVLSMLFMFAGIIGFGILMYVLIEVNTEKVRAWLFKRKSVMSERNTVRL